MTDRELDALIAEKVMGYTPKHGGRVVSVQDWISDEGDILNLDFSKDGWCYEDGQLPKWSTKIDRAWEVFHELGGLCGVGYGPGRKDWTAYFQINIDHPTHRASDKSAARAICLAALEAVGVDPAAQSEQEQGEDR